MKNKYSDGSLRRYIEPFVFCHVFLHEQVFMGKFVPSPLTNLPRTNQTIKDGASHWTQSLKVRTSKQHNSSILQTNQETREKLNLKQKS